MLRAAERMDPLAGFVRPMLEFLLAREQGPEQLPEIMAHPEQVHETHAIALGWMGLEEVALAPGTAPEQSPLALRMLAIIGPLVRLSAVVGLALAALVVVFYVITIVKFGHSGSM